MDLVLRQVAQLHHVDAANGDRALKLVAGPAIVERLLAKHRCSLALLAVQAARQLYQVVAVHRIDFGGRDIGGVLFEPHPEAGLASHSDKLLACEVSFVILVPDHVEIQAAIFQPCFHYGLVNAPIVQRLVINRPRLCDEPRPCEVVLYHDVGRAVEYRRFDRESQ